MNTVRAFYERQYGNYNGRNYDTPLGRLAVHESDSWKGIAPSMGGVDFNPEPPIFTAKFAKCQYQEHMLAIANEDGRIALQDTNIRSTVPESERSLTGQQCHYNAVFDLEWMPGHMKFLSASGDHTARLWEVRESTFESARVFNGHTRSVKTAAFRKNDAAVFATGGRDGAILIWDTRAAQNVGVMPRADNCIYSGHSGGPGTPMSACKRRTGTGGRAHTPKLPANVSFSSITGLVFQDDTTLVSCGAGDGIIKVWDLRRNYTSYKKEPLPKHSIPYPGTSTFKGYTNLMVDGGGVRLYVNCMDNSIYAFNLASYAAEPIIRYRGLRNSTFYIKSSLSPDGQYLLSGSSDEKAYIWNVRQSEPLVALVGHTVEVTCVAWSHAREMRVVTCSDDARHKIWRIGPETLAADEVVTQYRGRAEVCDEYWAQAREDAAGSVARRARGSSVPVRGRMRAMENTPRSVRRLMAENETTPSSAEKSATKRTFADMDDGAVNSAGDEDPATEGGDAKRPHLESKGRRLFSPQGCGSVAAGGSTQNGVGGSNGSVFYGGARSLGASNLASILEEADSSPVTVSAFVSTLTTPNTPLTSNQSRCGQNDQTPPTTATAAATTNAPAVAANCFFRPTTTTKQLFVSPPFTERLCTNSLKTPETPPNNPLSASAAHTFSGHSLAQYQHHHHHRSPALLGSAASSTASAIFSPTSNLPNYVMNGEAPHLQLQSPKRKLKENVDWLTKIRKQKLLSSINAQLNEKLSASDTDASSNGGGAPVVVAAGAAGAEMLVSRCESPRLHSLKNGLTDSPSSMHHQHHQQQKQQHPAAGSPSSSSASVTHTPRRRSSRSGSDAAKTPSSSRARNPESTLLRFFSRKKVAVASPTPGPSEAASPAAANSD